MQEGQAKPETYQWRAFAFVPVALDADFWQAFATSARWTAFHKTMDSLAFDDMRSFFDPAVADILCANEKTQGHYGRWQCSLENEQQPHAVLGVVQQPIKIAQVQLLRFPHLSAFIIEFHSGSSFDQEALLSVNREACRWLPRNLHDSIPTWQDGQGRQLSLAQWLIGMLPVSEHDKLSVAFAQSDWFGHQLPSFSIIRAQQPAEVLQADELTVKLLTAIPLNQDGYRLAPAIKQQILSEGVEQYWADWFFANHEGRYLAVLSQDAAEFVEDNLTQYYMPMVLLVIYQKLMAAHLLEQFHLCGLNEDQRGLARVRRRFTRFRHKFAFQRVTTYPLGNRVFSFIHRQADIDRQLARIAEQIESADNYEQLQIEQREAKTVILLTWLAALVLPITTVAVVFAVEQTLLKTFYPFWVISLVSTVTMLSVVFVFQRRNKKAGREE